MSKLVTIFGGSGFVGRYIARRMAKQGWRVRVAVRHPNEALFVKPYGAVGQVEPVLANIRDDASVAQALRGADAVVNCVGILSPVGKNSFDAVQADGAARVARLAAEAGISKMVHVSAIGADAASDSEYSRTKAAGEAGVMASMPSAVILRPSIVFGSEDEFFNRFAGMSQFSPALPIVGAQTKFQPVYVDDLAHAAEVALTTDIVGGVYELGGPEVKTFDALMRQMLGVIQRNRAVVHLPFPLARLMAFGFDIGEKVTFGLVKNPTVTRDQLKNLAVDNVVADDAQGFEAFGISPTPMDTVLPDYLWRFRPSGQYAEIKDSAKNLRD